MTPTSSGVPPVQRPAGRRVPVLHADLLLALALADGDVQAEQRLATLAGFALRGDVDAVPASGHDHAAAVLRQGVDAAADAPAAPGRATTDPAEGAARPPLRAGLVAVVRSEPTPQQEADDAAGDAVAPLTDADCAPLPGAEAPLPPPLQPRTRLWPALRRSASLARPAGLDLPQLVRRLSAAQPLRRLPQRQRSSWAGTLWVLQDESERLAPYQRDFDALVDELLRLRGVDGLLLWRFRGLPQAPCQRAGTRQAQAWDHALPPPPPGALLLVLSDMGALAPQPAHEADRLALVQGWRRAGADVQAWLPAAPAQVPQPLARSARLHCLGAPAGARGGLRAQRGAWAGAEQRQAEHARLAGLLAALQVRASCAVHLDVDLLRSLRLQSPALAAEPALEALYWQSPQVRASRVSRPLQADAAPSARSGLAALSAAEQAQVLQALQAHHAGHGRSTWVTEVLIWHAHASAAAAAEPQAVAALAEAHDWFRRWQADVLQGPAQADAGRSFADDLLAAQAGDAAWWQRHGAALAPVWAASGLAAMPAGLDPAQAAAARERQARARGAGKLPTAVVAHRGRLWLWPDGLGLPRAASAVLDAAPLSGVLVRQEPQGQPPGRMRWVASRSEPVDLGPLPAGDDQLMLARRAGRVWLSPVHRPPGVLAMGRDAEGLFVEMPALGEQAPFRLHPQPQQTQAAWPVYGGARIKGGEVRVGANLSMGFDFEFGAYADLVVGDVVQRFRWMAPGEFWMGSPDDEPGRQEDEGPRHRVRLTCGFWLAETTCTQALWQAVMGSNPSHFRGDARRPVEQVSFDDVQQFLRRLQPLLPPGCGASLPTEAEWEYACRAGTETAFHFGPTIDKTRVNFDARRDAPLAQLEGASPGTVPVRSLPPSPWGLYEMHGNVVEFCDGHLGPYPTLAVGEVVENPAFSKGSDHGTHGAVRGGSWDLGAAASRSAFRDAFLRDDSHQDLGLRVALKSVGQEGARLLRRS